MQQTTENKPKRKYNYTMKTGRPPKYRSVKAMADKIDTYFEITEIPTKAGLTLHLGFCSEASLRDYKDKMPKFSNLIKLTFSRLAEWWEQRLAGSACAGSIFWLKNNAGYTDKQALTTQDVTPELTPEEEAALTPAIKLYKEAMARGPA